MRTRIVIGLIVFSFSGVESAQESGLSEEDQTKLIVSLQNYIPLQNEVAGSSLKSNSNADQLCPEVPYPDDKFCLEQNYIKNGYYIVTITFEKLEQFSEEPHAPLIKGVRPFKRDTTNRDIYLTEISDAVFREYIGDDYNRFSKINLVMIRRNVVIEFHIQNASELTTVLSRPYTKNVKHIGNPNVPLEEISS